MAKRHQDSVTMANPTPLMPAKIDKFDKRNILLINILLPYLKSKLDTIYSKWGDEFSPFGDENWDYIYRSPPPRIPSIYIPSFSLQSLSQTANPFINVITEPNQQIASISSSSQTQTQGQTNGRQTQQTPAAEPLITCFTNIGSFKIEHPTGDSPLSSLIADNIESLFNQTQANKLDLDVIAQAKQTKACYQTLPSIGEVFSIEDTADRSRSSRDNEVTISGQDDSTFDRIIRLFHSHSILLVQLIKLCLKISLKYVFSFLQFTAPATVPVAIVLARCFRMVCRVTYRMYSYLKVLKTKFGPTIWYKFQVFFVSVYPYLHAASEALRLCFQLGYVFRIGDYTSFDNYCAGLQTSRVSMDDIMTRQRVADEERRQSLRRSSNDSIFRRVTNLVRFSRLRPSNLFPFIRNVFADSTQLIILASVFGFKFIEWWSNPQNASTRKTILPIPKPPQPPVPLPFTSTSASGHESSTVGTGRIDEVPEEVEDDDLQPFYVWEGGSNIVLSPFGASIVSGSRSKPLIKLHPDPLVCPLCHIKRTNTTCTPTGFLFCYRCIQNFVKEYESCPVTGAPVISSSLRRIFDDAEVVPSEPEISEAVDDDFET